MDAEVSLTFRTDDDGYFRRECPTCEREFKVWVQPARMQEFLARANDTSSTEERTCPYCGSSARMASWWTKAQVRYIDKAILSGASTQITETIDKSFEEMARRFRSGPLRMSFRRDGRATRTVPEPVNDPNDMRAIVTPNGGRIKVLETWNGPVHDHGGE